MNELSRANPYDTIAERYDELFVGNPFYDNVTEQEERVLDFHVPKTLSGERTALDLGCGPGDYTRQFADRGYRALGIDISEQMCSVARTRADEEQSSAKFLCMDAKRIGELDRCWDVIACMGSTLNHIDDWGGLFKEVEKSLSPGGRFIFSIDNFLGIDTLFWLLKIRHSGYSRDTRVRRFLDNLACLWRDAPFYNDWDMKYPQGKISVHLLYEPRKRLRRYIREAGLVIEEECGANLLSCLSPTILNASVELGASERPLGNLSRAAIRCDRLIARCLPSFSANRIVVVRRR